MLAGTGLRSLQSFSETTVFIESGVGNAHVDAAFRYSNVIGNHDLSLSLSHEISREARLPLSADGTHRAPLYDLFTQGGIDLRYIYEGWL